MNILDLFSGIGGFSLGLERAGMKTIAFCEKDKFCWKVLEKHWPKIPIFEDITKLKGGMINETIELVSGGFPCQPFSVAGKQKGKEDNRHLWPEMFRVIQETNPSWIIGENVAGIINMELEQVCTDLESEGYEVQAFIIPACAINAPHRRDRVWIVANSKGIRRKWGDSNERKTSGTNGEGIAPEFEGSGETFNTLSNTTSKRCNNRPEIETVGNKQLCGNVRDAKGTRFTSGIYGQREGEHGRTSTGLSWDKAEWFEVATRLCRVDDGVSNRVDRLKCLGNSVVPQIVEIIGNYIMEIERTSKIQKEMFV